MAAFFPVRHALHRFGGVKPFAAKNFCSKTVKRNCAAQSRSQQMRVWSWSRSVRAVVSLRAGTTFFLLALDVVGAAGFFRLFIGRTDRACTRPRPTRTWS